MKLPSLLELETYLAKNKITKPHKNQIITFAIGTIVPFFRTGSIKVEKISLSEVTLLMKNKRKVRNHMGTVHASAMGLLAEAASGVLLNMNLPSNAKYSATHINTEFTSKIKGDITAKASFSDEELDMIKNTDKGNITINVTVKDENKTSPGNFNITWAWKK